MFVRTDETCKFPEFIITRTVQKFELLPSYYLPIHSIHFFFKCKIVVSNKEINRSL